MTSDDHGSGTQAPHLGVNGSGPYYMPHNEHAAGELDRLFPSFVPPPDEELGDGDADVRDGVYQHGIKIAEEIRQKTAVEGRRKRPLDALQEQVRGPTLQQKRELVASEGQARSGRPLGGGVTKGTTSRGNGGDQRDGDGDHRRWQRLQRRPDAAAFPFKRFHPS